jgi:hypothetical protein
MLKVFLIVSALLTIVTVWGQNCGSCGLATVGVDAGQAVRLTVSAASSQSCAVQLGFVDEHGQSIGPSSRVSLEAGQSTILDLPSTGQRGKIRPRIVLESGTMASACRATAVVLDSPSASEEEPSDAPVDGIKVHGHWIIDLRNPDGTLATHREFENSLQPSGAAALASNLARQIVTGTWLIQLQGTVCSGFYCAIYENLDTNASGPNVFKPLTVGAPTSGSYSGDLVLSGSFIAPTSGTVTAVSTYVNTCMPEWAPASCTYGSTFSPAVNIAFTSTTQNITVIGGQLVEVTVVISFS